MYRPSGSESIWVPIGKLDWFWRGTARSVPCRDVSDATDQVTAAPPALAGGRRFA
jgi:hypothetical protein